MRFKAVALALGTLLFSLSAMPAFADAMPSFPDSGAAETPPLLLVGLLFAAAASGTSAWLLVRIQRARTEGATGASTEIAPSPEGTFDDSGFNHED